MGPIPCPHHVLRTAPVRVGTSSTAQASLARIIAIISTVAPPRIEAARAGRLGCGIDLNLRLGPPLEIGGGSSGNEEEERGWGPTAQSGAVVDVVAEPLESGEEPTVDKGLGKTSPAVEKSSTIWPAVRSSEGECDLEKESRKEAAEGAKESSGITRKADGDNVEEVIKKQQDEESQDTKGGASEEGQHKDTMRNLRKSNGSEGYLGLLLEAVRQVSGELFDEKPEKEKEKKAADHDNDDGEEERAPKRRAARVAQGSKRRGSERLPFDLYLDSAPIVRSKRGRSQTLPSRYRDSILDPWRKLPTITRYGRAVRP